MAHTATTNNERISKANSAESARDLLTVGSQQSHASATAFWHEVRARVVRLFKFTILVRESMKGFSRLGNFLKRFALISLLTNFVLLIGAVAYEKYGGTLSRAVSNGLNIGALAVPAGIVADRFVRQLGRVPSAKERWYLVVGSLVIATITPLITTGAGFLIVIVCALGYAAPEVYWSVISLLWQGSQISASLTNPKAWTIYGSAMVFVFGLCLFILHQIYGSWADKMLSAIQKKEKRAARNIPH